MSRMFRRVIFFALIVALVVPNVSLSAAPARQLGTGVISGSARTASGQAMPNVTVRLRNVRTGQIAGTTTADATGQFSFAGLDPGNYVVEVVNGAGAVVGTSATISLTATAMTATGLTVTASAAGPVGAAAGAGGSFFTSTAGIVLAAAIGAGVVGVVVAETRSNASPSQ